LEIWISGYLHPHDAKGNFEVRREPGFIVISAGEQVLIGHFPAGIDPVALESTEDAIEAALLDPEPALQCLNHLPMGVRLIQMHVERRRIGDAGPNKTSLAAPEFHAALEVRVEYPHAISPQRPWLEPASPKATC